MDQTKHALYRFYADDGTLLYVGITNNPSNRFGQHAGDKAWWHEVRGISMEPYPDRAAVLSAEARAIEVEHPRYNKSRPTIRKGRKAPVVQATQLVWVCEVCRQPIPDSQGYIHINHAEVRVVHQFWLAKDKETTGQAYGAVNLSDIDEWPAAAHWQVHHAICDPEPDSDDYHFGVERARTHAALLHWTAHLMGKAWVEHTDWIDLIDRLSGVDT